MLALLGFATIGLFIALVMTNRLSAVAALILIPVVFGLLGGFGFGLGEMMVKGIIQTAPTAVMLVFALLYFLIMYEAGLFEPFINGILKLVGDDPVKIVVGTAVLVMIVGFDGDGATAVLITISSMYPIYRRVGINPLIIALMLGLINPLMNWLPWGGPAARAAISLKVDVADIVGPMIPALIISLVATLIFAYYLGLSERRRLAGLAVASGPELEEHDLLPRERKVITPRNFWFNLLLTVGMMGSLAAGLAPLPALVMVGFAIAVTVNLPNIKEQQERLKPHGATVMMLVTLVLAAGAFTGILDETGMVKAMADSLISVVPESWGPFFGYISALLSMPLLIILSTDAFYFGVLPILGHTGAAHGVAPEVIARAGLIGMPMHSLSPLIAPIYFVASLLRTDVGSLQRFAWPWTIALSFVALIAAALTGAIPFP
ncbi:CitMHS family transporter [Brevundimonas goettingensis]|uniref:Citrate transporter n=1 Tax=Brevundimonas goettingensis TaxID=2774190 RepID=A0A975C636_9CAUL|nr:citrate:proton symporter [Brevundimonas goettingensis]QTC91941.1 citrate transporter [Brevundimonas goettingensis]